MTYLINLALGIAGSLIAAEIVFHHKQWCRRIIRAAAARINDPAQSDVKIEEWLAALDEHVGVFASFSHAIGCWFGAPAVAAALKLPVASQASSDHGEKTTIARVRIEVKSDLAARATKPLLNALREIMRTSLRESLSNMFHISEQVNNMFAEFLLRSKIRFFSVSLAALAGLLVSALSLFFWR